MSNKPSWVKRLQQAHREPPTLDVHIDPSRVREGHGVHLVSREPLWHIRCECGKEWKAEPEVKDAIERQAFEHVYEAKSA